MTLPLLIVLATSLVALAFNVAALVSMPPFDGEPSPVAMMIGARHERQSGHGGLVSDHTSRTLRCDCGWERPWRVRAN